VLLRDGATVYFWLGGHLPGIDRIYPLSVLVAELFRQTSGSGTAMGTMSLDFMLGDEKYKEKEVGAIPMRSIKVRTINRRLRSLLAEGVVDAKSLRPARAAKLITSSSGAGGSMDSLSKGESLQSRGHFRNRGVPVDDLSAPTGRRRDHAPAHLRRVN